MVTPLRTLLFLILVFGLTALMMGLVPEGGWRVGGITVKFPTWKAFWSDQARGQDVAMDAFFDIYARKDQDARADSLAAIEEAAFRERMRKIQFPEDDGTVWAGLLRDLPNRCRTGRVRVLHFGDSQIEGHRISGWLNRQWQELFGGTGPGWVPVVEAIPTPEVRQSAEGQWWRYTVFGTPRSKGHNRYGLLGAFARFTSQSGPMSEDGKTDTLATDPAFASSASFSLVPGRGGLPWRQARLAIGPRTDTLRYEIWAGDHLRDEGIWLPGEGMLSPSWSSASGWPEGIRVTLEGRVSPDFYGISLESEHGIFVDNIPMRGSSGTEFGKMDLSVMRQQCGEDDVALIILQFGGNIMPYLTDTAAAEEYGRFFSAQIRHLKRQFPEAAYLVIGPSDMSVKQDLQYVTYPLLPVVRDVMKAAAFSQGAAYYDLYEAMGGRNSMPGWVTADPPLAAADHVHFTPAGARKVADWILEAFREAGIPGQMPPNQ